MKPAGVFTTGTPVIQTMSMTPMQIIQVIQTVCKHPKAILSDVIFHKLPLSVI